MMATTALALAAEQGDTKALRAALKAGADPNELDGGTHAIHRAAFKGHTPVVKALIKAGASPATVDPRGFFPVQLAASGDHGTTIKALVDAGAPVDQRGAENGTALHAACAQGFLKAARALIKGGADLDARDDWGAPPFFYAGIQGHKATFNALVKAGSDLSARDAAGDNVVAHLWRSAFDFRVKHWRSEGSIQGVPVAYEVRNGVMKYYRAGKDSYISAKNIRLIASRFCPPHERYLDRISLGIKLVRGGVDITERGRDGWTPLLYGARLGLDYVGTLITKGADPTVRNDAGVGIAHLLAAAGDYQGVRLLRVALEKTKRIKDTDFLAALHAPDKDGWNSLHYLATAQPDHVDMYRREITWAGANTKALAEQETTAARDEVPAGSRPIDVATHHGTPGGYALTL